MSEEIDTFTDSETRPTIRKDPDAVLDYQVFWNAYLDDLEDEILSGLFLAEEGLTIDRQNFGLTGGLVWLSGGAVGRTYRVTCRITTRDGRTDDRSFFVKIVQR